MPEREDATPLGGWPCRLERSCAIRPGDSPTEDAVVFPSLGLCWSWAELDRRVDLLASALIAQRSRARAEPRRHLVDELARSGLVTQFGRGAHRIGLVNINPGLSPA